VSKAHIHQKHCETSTHFKPHSVSGMRSADKGDCTPSLSYHRFKLVPALALTNKSPNFILSTYNSTSLTSPTQTS
jgi:hypothetical protein